MSTDQHDLKPNPFTQFLAWYEQALKYGGFDPSPMVVATVDDEGKPDARIVLLKEFNSEGFIFYTHYTSPKARQAERIGIVALVLYWQPMNRQIRIKGVIKRTARKKSEAYFASRPRESQINTLASTQSKRLASQVELLDKIAELSTQFINKPIPCPETWGGFCVIPYEYEFFQGQAFRLNERIRYRKINEIWISEELSP